MVRKPKDYPIQRGATNRYPAPWSEPSCEINWDEESERNNEHISGYSKEHCIWCDAGGHKERKKYPDALPEQDAIPSL